ncbi:MAG: hypothetical protein DYG89_43595 [Caldilinea sp. CFX5]|nr:hypothetical protein [Caldilinea sp. CFX5]
MLSANTLLQERYLIVQRIGMGGMGAVYEAMDQRLRHTVAVKQIVRGEPRAFEQEARLLARLRHTALPKVTDHFIDETGQFLVMDFVAGNDLANALALRGSAFPLTDVLAWADQLLAVLTYLHAAEPPVIHRDIKPGNLKLTPSGELMLLDFGLAKGQTHQTETPPTSVPGFSKHFASPEQRHGETTDIRSDLYSVGATLYHLLTNTRPVDAAQRTFAALTGEPDPLPPVHHLNLAIPPVISEVLRKALALDPQHRFASAQAMRDALQHALTTPLTEVGSSEANGALPPTTLPAPIAIPNNLPAQLTTLVGRTEESNAIQQLLQRTDVRLVTLTGPGGVGKTRLGLRVAEAVLSQFPDGVFFVSLAPIRDPNLVISTITQTLGVSEVGSTPLLESLQAHLRDKQMLLLIDNFEQVIDAAPRLTDLLTTCPRLKILATSRELLNLSPEHQYSVPVLPLPDLTHLPHLEALAQVAAVDLFVQRAQAHKPDFALDAVNARIVAELCIRLDGLPLAIELASARVKLLTPQAMLTKLDDRFKLLRGGARDLPDRQRTLQTTLDWSYDLLTEAEKTLFRRLAVFVGGQTLAASQTVCNPVDDVKVPPLPIDYLDGLASLLDKSLLYQTIGVDDESRYMMLATIHEYALKQLTQSGEKEALFKRHAIFYADMVEQIDPELLGPHQELGWKRLQAEYDNIRTALQSAEESRESAIGLRLGGAMWQFWMRQGHIAEGRLRLEKFLAMSNAEKNGDRAKALTTAGILAHFQSDFGAAQTLYEESLQIRRELGLERGIASSLNNLGVLAMNQGDYLKARILYEECLAIEQRLGLDQDIPGSLMNLGLIAYYQGEYLKAISLYEESLLLYKKLDRKHTIADLYLNLSSVAYSQCDYTTAYKHAQESIAISRELGYQWCLAASLGTLGSTARSQGDHQAAHRALAEGLTIIRELGDKRVIAGLLENFGILAVTRGQLERALCLFGAAARLRELTGIPLPPIEQAEYEQNLKTAKQGVRQETAVQAWHIGQSFTLEQAIDFALVEVDSAS